MLILHYLGQKSYSSIYQQEVPILKVERLKTYFDVKPDKVKAVDGISFELAYGETLGIVGESGSGKSVTMLSIMQLVESPGIVLEGTAVYCDNVTSSSTDLLSLSEKEIAKYRGSKIGIVYQQAISAFNPIQTIGQQLKEAILIHDKSRPQLDLYLQDLLGKVRIEEPKRILTAYPHQLSGGQLQRCMIAMAIANEPRILIADEPTTGLDVITQKGVLELLKELRSELDMSMIFISHDLGVIAEMANQVLVMKEGVIIERGETKHIFENPKQEYTQALLHCRPRITASSKRLPTYERLKNGALLNDEIYRPETNAELKKRQEYISNQPELMTANGLSKTFFIKKGLLNKSIHEVKAVNDVSVVLRKGEVLGIVGESGSGKSTLAKLLLALESPTAGTVVYGGEDILQLNGKALKRIRKDLQIIFQDVTGSLDPRMTAEASIGMALSIHFSELTAVEKKNRIKTIMISVGLSEGHLGRYPHELSGGERQRVTIARAIAVEPSVLICDECVSALDVSVQAQILNLLLDLRDSLDLSIIFISHDLAVINFLCDRMLVMRDGRIVDKGIPTEILRSTNNEYTIKLLQSLPGQRSI